ncbi:probable E3 ubiquitin-protein ligase RNF144A-A isoform X1 [Biomphalaria glabrata]|uniref:E3 ubiquitin-protein ligase RNF144B n=2 Tax=Biomphalaria glabrata TaxID=6526 RepID=A0A9W3ADY7_BIOGL|nr:probable E3 ubiquitin-protein ligase RNF144A-A isoform X1 [Biomphalaria glabrata]
MMSECDADLDCVSGGGRPNVDPVTRDCILDMTSFTCPEMATFSVSKNTVDLAIDPLILCKLCLSELPLVDMYELVDCKCLFCEMCMKQYLSVMITEGLVGDLTCPDAQCKKQGKLNIEEIEHLVDRQTFQRFQRLHFQREVDLDPNRTFCPEIGCETVCHVCSSQSHAGGGAAAPTSIPVQCPTCGLQFCSVCKTKWHAPKSCDEVVASGPIEEFGIPFHNSDDAKIKRCPVCHVPIERNDGCAQMMCKRCKHVFCWYCLQSLDDDFLLRHYDKGPCKNKLGHSRASVIWHRTQVVGIFAGFGVLLLVASPFLLLAAPCILCCKCKICRCCDEEEGDGFSN